MGKGRTLKYKMTYLMGMQNSMEYRANYMINLVSVFVPIIIRYFVWNAVYSGKAAGTTVFDYTYAQMLTYSVAAGFIAKITGSGFHYNISDDIKSGNLSKFLVQPINYFSFRAVYYLGEKTSESIVIFAVMAAVLGILAPVLGLHIKFIDVCLLVLDLLPALALSFLMFFAVSLLAFWVVEVKHLFGVIDILVAIASGAILPLSIFGNKALYIIELLPFPYTTYFLANILSGKAHAEVFAKGLQMQCIWIFILANLCYVLWKQGLKKYAAAGG